MKGERLTAPGNWYPLVLLVSLSLRLEMLPLCIQIDELSHWLNFWLPSWQDLDCTCLHSFCSYQLWHVYCWWWSRKAWLLLLKREKRPRPCHWCILARHKISFFCHPFLPAWFSLLHTSSRGCKIPRAWSMVGWFGWHCTVRLEWDLIWSYSSSVPLQSQPAWHTSHFPFLSGCLVV